MNPNASEVDYLPTQYLAELIQSQGYDGLVFNSAMGSGQNLVLFDPKKAIASSVSLFKVSNVQYSIECPYHIPSVVQHHVGSWPVLVWLILV